jgi:translation initiation factor eIF-2B subunit alpha
MSLAGTMFELVKALNEGAEALKRQSSNPISLNAGCELFIAFVTLFPHESVVRTITAFFLPVFLLTH